MSKISERNKRTTILALQNASKATFIASVFVFIFYFTGFVLLSNVYEYAFVGALFEMLSIPMLLLLVTIPVFCLVQILKSKGTARLYAVASLLLIVMAILILVKAFI